MLGNEDCTQDKKRHSDADECYRPKTKVLVQDGAGRVLRVVVQGDFFACIESLNNARTECDTRGVVGDTIDDVFVNEVLRLDSAFVGLDFDPLFHGNKVAGGFYPISAASPLDGCFGPYDRAQETQGRRHDAKIKTHLMRMCWSRFGWQDIKMGMSESNWGVG